MAFPTKHWGNFNGTLTPGARVTIAHGLTSGLQRIDTGIHRPCTTFSPDNLNSAPPNVSIGCFQNSDATNIYLTNWDPANTQRYSVMVRLYHDIDGRNV